MTASTLVASSPAAAASLSTGLKSALDIDDNGILGWPDLLAWLFFGTVGLLGVAVVAGMALGGMAVLLHVIRRSAGLLWSLLRRHADHDTGQQSVSPSPRGSGVEAEPVRSASPSITWTRREVSSRQ